MKGPTVGTMKEIRERAAAVNIYETSATVEEQGQVHLADVPFAPGTEVEVTVRAKTSADSNGSPANVEVASARMRDLFARVRARNTEPVGPLHREELHDRGMLR